MADRFFTSSRDEYAPRKDVPVTRRASPGADQPVARYGAGRDQGLRDDLQQGDHDHWHPNSGNPPQGGRAYDPPRFDRDSYDSAPYDPHADRRLDYDRETRDLGRSGYAPSAPERPQYARPDYDRPDYARPQHDRSDYDRSGYARPQYDHPDYARPDDDRQNEGRSRNADLVADNRAWGQGAHRRQPANPQSYDARYDSRAPDAPVARSYPAQDAPRDPRAALPYAAAQEPRPYAMPTELGFDPAPERFGRVIHWAGTLTSAVILCSAVYWGYDLAVRDVQGIPVVRASLAPLRIAPDNPGGKVMENQGLAVNAIAASGGAAPMPQQVVLAPAPVALAAEDLAPADDTTAETAVATASEQPSEQTAEPTIALADLPEKLPDDMPISDASAVEAALNMALTEGDPEAVTKSNTDAAQPLAIQDSAAQDTVTAPPTAEMDPATIAPGTKMVQLGAFDDESSARAAWADLQTRFAELIGPKALVVQQAKSGGRLFYRLRAHGFADEDETRRFCAALLAENASCIPVAQR